MYKLLFLFICIICLSEASISAMFEGGVEKTGVGTNSVILDAQTNIPIENVKISLPKHNFTTYTNSNGAFFLNTKIDAPTILSIEKEGYRPYSITIDKTNLKNPLIISIEKSSLDCD